VRFLRTRLLLGILALLPVLSAQAFDLEQSLRDLQPRPHQDTLLDYHLTQQNGMSLAEAIESVRRRTGGRILSAETRLQGGREVHHIKVLTEDGKVKTHRVPGRKSGGR